MLLALTLAFCTTTITATIATTATPTTTIINNEINNNDAQCAQYSQISDRHVFKQRSQIHER